MENKDKILEIQKQLGEEAFEALQTGSFSNIVIGITTNNGMHYAANGVMPTLVGLAEILRQKVLGWSIAVQTDKSNKEQK